MVLLLVMWWFENCKPVLIVVVIVVNLGTAVSIVKFMLIVVWLSELW